jgi:hypothetical protein
MKTPGQVMYECYHDARGEYHAVNSGDEPIAFDQLWENGKKIWEAAALRFERELNARSGSV